jgi:queuine tRNA-ribosyltransferase
MPVGTAGTVKAIHQHELRNEIDAPVILGNTYHLFLRPGIDVIAKAGGIHKYINWDRNILTDSGGYQVFSLAANRKLNENGVVFQSHIDGSSHLFTPANVVDIQRQIGSDIIMALDECTPYPCEYKDAKLSMELTHNWLKKGIDQYHNTEPLYGYDQTFFPIVQGGTHAGLRKQSAEYMASFEAAGNAIGGLSVGEPADEMYAMIETVNAILPVYKPRYLMGVGMPVNIIEAVARGVDMFDCVIPTRNGRNGMLFTKQGIINIKNEKWKYCFDAIEENGHACIDNQYSKSYLRHLIVSKEILGAQIASIHNLCFYMWLMNEIRDKIQSGEFNNWRKKMVIQLSNRL